MVNTTLEETPKGCGGDETCFLKSFNEAYRSFVIYLNLDLSRIPGDVYFQQIGNKAGYYLADVVRRRLVRVQSYAAGIQLLKDGYKSVDSKHLCKAIPKVPVVVVVVTTLAAAIDRPYVSSTIPAELSSVVTN